MIPVCKKFKSQEEKTTCSCPSTEFDDKKHIITIPFGKHYFDCGCEYVCPPSKCAKYAEKGEELRFHYKCPKCKK